MAARTFEDSEGATWEVFEVHRASDKPGAVSSGLELGWLAFVREGEKRRLAPFPSEWEQADDAALARLCGQARLATPRPSQPRVAVRRRPTPPGGEAVTDGAVLEQSEMPDESLTEIPGDLEVRDAVRTFAHEARMTGLPAVDAMVRLKAMLAERFPGADHAARDNRLVRRAFVDAYYFERDA